MDTICGHKRESLRVTLERLVSARFMPWEAIAHEALSKDGATRENCPDSARVLDLHDPIKLADILAQLLRERGVDVGEPGPLYANNRWFGEPGRPGVWMVVAYGYIQISVKEPQKIFVEMDDKQARAFAFRVLTWDGDFDLARALVGEQ